MFVVFSLHYKTRKLKLKNASTSVGSHRLYATKLCFVTNSIPYSLALRIVRICSEPEDKETKMEELRQMLVSRNYNRNIVNAAITKAKTVTRGMALQKVVKKKKCSPTHPNID